jgi:hypothetical protein
LALVVVGELGIIILEIPEETLFLIPLPQQVVVVDSVTIQEQIMEGLVVVAPQVTRLLVLELLDKVMMEVVALQVAEGEVERVRLVPLTGVVQLVVLV